MSEEYSLVFTADRFDIKPTHNPFKEKLFPDLYFSDNRLT